MPSVFPRKCAGNLTPGANGPVLSLTTTWEEVCGVVHNSRSNSGGTRTRNRTPILWIERYSIDGVGASPEVRNEPDPAAFRTATQAGYFMPYRVPAPKDLDAPLHVGGPPTEWITEFIEFREQNSVPLDFVTTHSCQ